MNLLLDTHALLWFIDRDSKLSRRARQLLEHQDNSALVSIASIWEIAIKVGLGKLKLKLQLEGELENFLEENGFDLLAIDYSHAAGVSTLPRHHADPFDRLLIVQSLVETMPLVSHDTRLDIYGVNRIW
ncbi:MAG TPA: type II toxin-antitoxin system VapC family toxin [Verrucomicrobiae bacterium]|jgi:PIN domain nuclease of toxin-antitoxin system|nr:type II toxin-antitoxin system VapC family toxin [Verrucomicrobiae bacterium]